MHTDKILTSLECNPYLVLLLKWDKVFLTFVLKKKDLTDRPFFFFSLCRQTKQFIFLPNLESMNANTKILEHCYIISQKLQKKRKRCDLIFIKLPFIPVTLLHYNQCLCHTFPHHLKYIK